MLQVHIQTLQNTVTVPFTTHKAPPLPPGPEDTIVLQAPCPRGTGPSWSLNSHCSRTHKINLPPVMTLTMYFPCSKSCYNSPLPADTVLTPNLAQAFKGLNLTYHTGASLVAQTVKNLPAVWETQVRSLGREDPLEKRIATHSSILSWRIPWTEEPGGL